MKRFNSFIKSAAGIGIIFFVFGNLYHYWSLLQHISTHAHLNFAFPLNIPSLYSILPFILGQYVILLIISLSISSTTVVLGGGLGILTGEILYTGVRLEAGNFFFGHPLLQLLPLTVGLLLGWVAARTRRDDTDKQTTVPDSTGHRPVIWHIIASALLLAIVAASIIPLFYIVTYFILPLAAWFPIARKIGDKAFISASGVVFFLFYLTVLVWAELPYMPLDFLSFARMHPFFGIFDLLPFSIFVGWLAKVIFNLPRMPRKIILSLITISAIALLLALAPHSSSEFLKKIDVQASIGEPRIILGAEQFQKIRMETGREWLYPSGLFGPPDKLLSLDGRKFSILNSHDLGVEQETPWGSALNSHMSLGSATFPIRIKKDGEWRIFVRDALYDLNGVQLWRKEGYHYWSAADLDEDGEMEFYAVNNMQAARINADGQQVWGKGTRVNKTRPLPRQGKTPAMLLAELVTSTELWNIDGTLTRTISPGPRSEISAIPWRNAYYLAYSTGTNGAIQGTSNFNVYDLNGKIIMSGEFCNPNMSFIQALAVKFEQDKDPYLVVHGAVYITGVHRGEIDIFTMDGHKVYQEIFSSAVWDLLPATDSDNNQYLLVKHKTYDYAYKIRPPLGLSPDIVADNLAAAVPAPFTQPTDRENAAR